MSQPAIEVSDLSKVYRIGHERKGMKGTATLRDSLAEIGRKPIELITGRQLKKEEFWALKDINFEVQQGDVVGIIGKNGSGKSTLLKILSQIVEPTTGEVHMRGKVASLLEVGTGFHPELTGRENIFFNGAILGMKRKEIISKFDEIVAFSEVEQFLDTPVKFYSSGMYVRLAFAVAAHLDPDILIVDEVLAVGDAAFQKKSLGKMKSVAASGRTVLFVSHSMESVLSLCNKAILLEKGKIKLSGDTQSVTDRYASSPRQHSSNLKFEEDNDKVAQFLEASVQSCAGKTADEVGLDEEWQLRLKYKISEPREGTIIAAEVLSRSGDNLLMTSNSDLDNKIRGLEAGTYEAVIPFEDVHFMPGTYPIRITIQSPGVAMFDDYDNLQLTVRGSGADIRSTYFDGKYMGYYSKRIKWDVEKSKTD